MTSAFIAAGSLGESFDKLINNMFLKIDGCLVERTAKGFIIFGEEVSTIEQVKERIAKSARALNDSIVG